MHSAHIYKENKSGKTIKAIHHQPLKQRKYDPAAHLRFKTMVVGE